MKWMILMVCSDLGFGFNVLVERVNICQENEIVERMLSYFVLSLFLSILFYFFGHTVCLFHRFYFVSNVLRYFTPKLIHPYFGRIVTMILRQMHVTWIRVFLLDVCVCVCASLWWMSFTHFDVLWLVSWAK